MLNNVTPNVFIVNLQHLFGIGREGFKKTVGFKINSLCCVTKND